jgi:hypothetical protein
VLGSFWSSISVGRITTCGVTTLGTGLCWGFNQRGEAGTAATAIGASALMPTALSVGDDVKFKRVVAGWLHACGITTNDTVLCWGDNRSGQLGIGGIDAPEVPATEHRVPTAISSDERFADVSLGATQTCGITLDHRATYFGIVSDGKPVRRTSTRPTLIDKPPWIEVCRDCDRQWFRRRHERLAAEYRPSGQRWAHMRAHRIWSAVLLGMERRWPTWRRHRRSVVAPGCSEGG